MIEFKTQLVDVCGRTLMVLPLEASAQLPSRGLALVSGTINDVPFLTALEPDGKGSHWFAVDSNVFKAGVGDVVRVQIEPSKEWPEPSVPDDLQAALDDDPEAMQLWRAVTPMARWDWTRWIRSTNNPETRAKHIVVAFSKLKNGTKRPCCFNRSMCTDMTVAKSGVLATK